MTLARTRQLKALSPGGVPGVFVFDHRVVRFDPRPGASGEYAIPGFIDLQVNGAFGIDVMSASSAGLREISRQLPFEGTTAWLPTVITAPLDVVEGIDQVIAEAIVEQRETALAGGSSDHRPLEAAILGMHLEGPFISSRRLGAHPALNLLPRGESLERVLRLRTVKLITVAPELDGALDAISRFVRKGVAVSVGHTDANYDQAIAAVRAGARMFTHVFNAMPPLHHRAPGTAGAALDNSAAVAALIADGIHVDPAMLRLAWRARGADGTLFISDRIAPAGGKMDHVALFGGTVEARIVAGAARLPDGTLAGSLITMLDAIRNMRRYAEIDAMGITGAASDNPARVLRFGDRGNLRQRSRADFLLLDRNLDLKVVFIGGRELA